MSKLKLIGIIMSVLSVAACDEDTYGIGNSLTDDADKLDITSNVYTVASRTIVADSVLSTSDVCYFGKVKDPETGTYIKSEFSTQLNILETLYISPEDSIVSRYDGVAGADSCDIILYTSSPFLAKDSLIAMKMRVKELQAPIEESMTLYTNYDLAANGLIRADGINQSKVFTYNDLNETDSARALSTYLPNIRIVMNEPYTAPDGQQYNNYGSYILQQYYRHPEYFKNSYQFAHNVCPGFFFELTDGLGFHSKVTDIGLRVFYRVTNDSTYNAVLTLAGTEEVLQANKITNDLAAMQRLAADRSCTYIKSPAGLYTELTLPVDDIMTHHENDSLLAAKIILQRMNNEVQSSQSLGVPAHLLMVQADSLTTFFENGKLPNSNSSFYTTYSGSSSSSINTNTYTFDNISNLVTLMWNTKENGLKTDAQWLEKHPAWNKVVLVPVNVSTTSSSSSYATKVSHDMSLASTRLVGGEDNPDAVQVSVVYAKFQEK